MKIAPFLSWCSAQGVVSPFELTERQSYRYMAFKEKPPTLSSDERFEVLRVPLEACLTGRTSEALAERLSQERALGAESEFAPWLDLLPSMEEYQETLPRFWNEDRLSTICDGGALQRKLQVDRKRLEQVQDQWALACVDSRANFLPDQTYTLMPLLDMFNHDCSVVTRAEIVAEKEEDGDGKPCLSLSVDSKSLETKENDDSNDGENWKNLFGLFQPSKSDKDNWREVFISYGDLTNLETLCNFGFVVPTNPANTELVYIRMIGKSPVAMEVQAADGSLDAISIARLRGYLAAPADLIDLDPDLWEYPPEMLSRGNEIEVYALISGCIEEAVKDAQRAAKASDQDPLIAEYHEGRVWTLAKSLERIREDFPEIFSV